MQPIEIHCHGIGDVDFSDIGNLDLRAVNELAVRESTRIVLTSFIRPDQLDEAEEKLREFSRLRSRGSLSNLLGFGIEGPLLANHGGTPPATTWRPTRGQWEQIFAWGALGVHYTVLAPDIWSAEPEYADEVSQRWLVEGLMRAGIRIALGHFSRTDPTSSAQEIDRVIALATQVSSGPEGVRVFTDHMLNDMPRRIAHAFRTGAERRDRPLLIGQWRISEWEDDRLEDIVGPVPAVLMARARSADIALSVNFDGDHLDRELAIAIVGYVGAENACLMTDRCERQSLAGQTLTLGVENTLLYQQGGIVAAGSKGVLQQTSELIRERVAPGLIRKLTVETPQKILAI